MHRRRIRAWLGLWLAVVVFGAIVDVASAAESVTFKAADGAKVYADVYAATGDAKATILLFHQAGSNRGEYAPIAPKLAQLTYNAVAIDARVGDDLWGRTNQTANEQKPDEGYFAALADLEGALTYAMQTWPGVPVIAWGSSYSASLVFFLAAQHPREIAALLAFSPGEYFSTVSVRDYAKKVECPVFVTSASDPAEITEARRLFAAVPAANKTLYVPRIGIHGASTLRADSNPRGAAIAWSAVVAFLDALPTRTGRLPL